MKLHTLPIIEHWDCQGCSTCCRETTIRLSVEDVAKLESQNWQERPEFRDYPNKTSRVIPVILLERVA